MDNVLNEEDYPMLFSEEFLHILPNLKDLESFQLLTLKFKNFFKTE